MNQVSMKFASYARLASHPQADLTPIREQLAAIKAYGEARGWQCVGEYSDAPGSGVSIHRMSETAR